MTMPLTQHQKRLVALLHADWIPVGKLATYTSVAGEFEVMAFEVWEWVDSLSVLSRRIEGSDVQFLDLPWHRIVGSDGKLNKSYPEGFRKALVEKGHSMQLNKYRQWCVVPFVDHHLKLAARAVPPDKDYVPTWKQRKDALRRIDGQLNELDARRRA